MELAEYGIVHIEETDKQGNSWDNIKMICGRSAEDYLDLVLVNRLAAYFPREVNPLRSEN